MKHISGLACLLGLLEGLKVEKADLQETLGKKEESEQQLILELENLQNQLQQAAQELATLREENSVLWNQKETFTNEAKEREAGESWRWWRTEWDRGAAADPSVHINLVFEEEEIQKARGMSGSPWLGGMLYGKCRPREGQLARV